MKQIERFSLIDRIARELQGRMSYEDIASYLAGFGVNRSQATRDSYSSKWIYAKDLLNVVSKDTLLRIADELEIPHGFSVPGPGRIVESRFWTANHFRLFLTHISSFRKTVGALQVSLKRFAISAFVAHVDIEPTKEWQAEIEAALFSMDALAAILMPGFKESNWTDQEVGVAIGRQSLVIPVMRGVTPHGFIGKYQGFDSNEKTVPQVAEALFRIIISSDQTRARMIKSLVDSTANARTVEHAAQFLSILRSVENLPVSYVEQLRDSVLKSTLLIQSEDFVTALNLLVAQAGLGTIRVGAVASETPEEDIPF